ncbi:MAG: hypothetical protein O7C75_07900 [Verrucomicrobia bacterium]|nr:hypothetical protein [Verrucomicrobiota bacterium]
MTNILADMSQCSPNNRLSKDYEDGHWQLTEYETADGVKGTMVSAAPEHDCGELTLALNAKGLHKIYLGICFTKPQPDGWSQYGEFGVKLDGDYGYSRVGPENMRVHAGHIPSKMGIRNEIYRSIQETYWKTADLTDKNLILSQLWYPYNRAEHHPIANLSYVKLVPLAEEEIEQWKTDSPSKVTQNLGQMFCTGQITGHTSGTYNFHPTDEQWFRNELEPVIKSDFKLFIFEALRGSYASYKTKIGYFGNKEDKWEEDWLDPVEIFTRLCHENGLKMFVSMRMIGPQHPMNRAPIARAKHYEEMPQFAKRDKLGRPTTGLSLAYPEVRQYWLSLLRETLEYGIDGIQLHLNRSNPFVMYEEPVVKAFQEKYGEDPRELPESDPRYINLQAGYTTQFVREVNGLVNETPNRELAVTFYGRPHKYDQERENFHPIRYGCDIEGWIREGLVDYLMPSPKIDTGLISKWRELVGDRVHIWPDLMPRTQPAEMYAALAKKYYEAGADGFCFWDGERRTQRLSEWAAVRRLGHRDQLDQIINHGSEFYRKINLETLGIFSARESYHDG